MKKLISLAVLLFFFFSVFSQSVKYEDVVYLKNGSIIYGQIIEQIPGEYIKIKSGDKNLLVFRMDEIEKITKKEIKAPVSPRSEKFRNVKIKENGYEFSIGMSVFGTPPSSPFFDVVHSASGIGFSVINSYRFSPRFVAGIGIAYEAYNHIYNSSFDIKTLPVFLDLQYSVLKHAVSPLLSVSGGYSFGWIVNNTNLNHIYDDIKSHGDAAGLLINPMVGVKFTFVKHASLLIRIGYKLQQLDQWSYYHIYPQNTFITHKKINYGMIALKIEYVF